jgi:hypothetical protein
VLVAPKPRVDLPALKDEMPGTALCFAGVGACDDVREVLLRAVCSADADVRVRIVEGGQLQCHRSFSCTWEMCCKCSAGDVKERGKRMGASRGARACSHICVEGSGESDCEQRGVE